MAKSQKDIKGWELIFDDKSGHRRARRSIRGGDSGTGNSITLKRVSDGLIIKEGDCITFNLKNENDDYSVTSMGFVKDIMLAVDMFLKVRVLWFVRYSDSLKDVIPKVDDGMDYTANDIFLTPFLDSIELPQIVGNFEVIGRKKVNGITANVNVNDSSRTYICQRFTDGSSGYFTDLIDWEMMRDLFFQNKNEFYDSLKIMTVKPTLSVSRQSSPRKGKKANDGRESFATISSNIKIKKEELLKRSVSDTEYDDDGEEDNDSDNYQDIEVNEDESDDDDDDEKDDELSEFRYNDEDIEEALVNVSEYGMRKKRKYTKRSNFKSGTNGKIAPQLPQLDSAFKVLEDSSNKYSTTRMLTEAKKVLGTGSRLKALPCREEEFHQLYHELESCVKSQKGRCFYVSGTPGVGKTATIREVVKQLFANLTIENEGHKQFDYLEINGLKLIRPQQSYEILWKKISGISASANNSLTFLQQHLERENDDGTDSVDDGDDEFKNRLPLVVLLDELDQVVTKNQAVMYNFFNWPTYQNSKLIVIAVANTMDLPERLLTNKISSRLGLSRIQFTSYSYAQLSEIIKHRLEELSLSNDKLLITKDAIEFASRKVASVSGDARRSLMICIRAVEIAQHEFMKKSLAEKRELDGKYTVTIMHIMKAVNETSNSPAVGYLDTLSFLSKFMLACLLLRKKRTGIAEIRVGEIYDEMNNQVQLLLFTDVKNKLDEEGLNFFDVVFGFGQKGMKASVINTGLYVLKDLEENGILMMQVMSIERDRLVRLNVSDDEILNCFKKDAFFKELLTFI